MGNCDKLCFDFINLHLSVCSIYLSLSLPISTGNRQKSRTNSSVGYPNFFMSTTTQLCAPILESTTAFMTRSKRNISSISRLLSLRSCKSGRLVMQVAERRVILIPLSKRVMQEDLLRPTRATNNFWSHSSFIILCFMSILSMCSDV